MESADGPSCDWSVEACLEIGVALLAGDATAREIADAVGTHQSNVKKRADAMVEAGLLVPGRQATEGPRRGARPATYALAADEHDRVAALAEAARRNYAEGEHVVFADAHSGVLADLFGVIAHARAATRAQRSIFLPGERPQYAVFYAAEDADAAVELVASLRAVEVESYAAVTGPTVPGHEFVRHARRAADAARRAAVRNLTRRAAG